MTKPLRTVAMLLAAATVVAGCGSTRFVVVESDAAGTGAAGTGSSASASQGATPPSSAAAGPSAAANDKDDAAIRKTLAEALAVDDRPMRRRLPYLEEEAGDLNATYQAVQEIVKDFDVDIIVDAITTAGDEATATVSVNVDGVSFASGLPVKLVRQEEKWLVTRDGACTLLALASPCPDPA